MRPVSILVSCLLVSGIAFSVQSTPQTTSRTSEALARLEGQILDGTTDSPLRNVRVRLMPGNMQTTTDAEGLFVLSDLPPGAHTLYATRSGYGSARLNGRRIPGNDGIPLVLNAADRLRGTLRMYPGAIATGRVITARGRPAQGVEVTPFRWTYSDLGRREPRYFGAQTTNDLGEFRFHDLHAGDYGFRIQGRGLGLNEFASSVFFPFYYSGTMDPMSAELVSLEGGVETQLKDLILPPSQPAGTLRVQLEGPVGQSVTERPYLRIIPSGGSGALRSGTLDVQAEWTTTGNLPFGRYEVEVTSSSGSGRVGVDLYQPAFDLLVPITRHTTLKGRIVAEGDGDKAFRPVPGATLEFISPEVSRAYGRDMPARVTTDPEGRFLLRTGPRNTTYFLRLLAIPPDLYPTALFHGGRDVFTDGLRVESDDEVELEILFRENAGAVEGNVTDSTGQTRPGATVALVPEDHSQSHMFAQGISDSDGRFRIESVVPGIYRLHAWVELDGTAYKNDEFMAAHGDQGVVVVVEPDADVVVDVTLSAEAPL